MFDTKINNIIEGRADEIRELAQLLVYDYLQSGDYTDFEKGEFSRRASDNLRNWIIDELQQEVTL